MSALSELLQAGELLPIHYAFASTLMRMHEEPLVGLTAALVAQQRSLGHSCICLETFADRPFPALNAEQGIWSKTNIRFPSMPEWLDELKRSTSIGVVDTTEGLKKTTILKPLILDAGRVYLYRYWIAERRIAHALAERVCSDSAGDLAAAETLKRTFELLFPRQDGMEDDLQSVAAVCALRARFCVITGGPGTGKTTTIVRAIILLLSMYPDLKIALAAPTGKAAARMAEAIGRQMHGLESLGFDKETLEAIPRTAQTLHRLLKYLPLEDRFRFNEQNRLPYDLVILDEASMVDVLGMERLIVALRPSARLIVLGDRRQLASVEAGSVLNDLFLAAAERNASVRAKSSAFSSYYRQLSSRNTEFPATAEMSLIDCIVELEKSYRFRSETLVGRLAQIVKERQSEMLEALLSDEAAAVLPPTAAHLQQALNDWQHIFKSWHEAADPASAFNALNRMRILCALRVGVLGALHVNRLVERWLQTQGIEIRGNYYKGRPLMVVQNDYRERLYNGDLGICWPEGEHLFAWFPDELGRMRRVALSKLPAHETAWAMTVHKSQGSEFDEVLLIFPENDNDLFTQELLYTGLTRARKNIRLLASLALLKSILQRSVRRSSGLSETIRKTLVERESRSNHAAIFTQNPLAGDQGGKEQ